MADQKPAGRKPCSDQEQDPKTLTISESGAKLRRMIKEAEKKGQMIVL